LIDIQVENACLPKPLVANSVPNLLNIMQSEWDASMLEIYNLRENLNDTRKELAHALYQYDAACRVISKIVKDKDYSSSQLKMANE
jgi:pre-mRNA-processing factor 19